MALTHLTGRLFIGFISIMGLQEKTGGAEKEVEMKEELRGIKCKEVKGGTRLGIGMWLHQCAFTRVCAWMI